MSIVKTIRAMEADVVIIQWHKFDGTIVEQKVTVPKENKWEKLPPREPDFKVR